MLKTLAALLLAAACGSALAADDSATPALPPITLYAPSPCLACIDWADHLRQAGFVVSIEEKEAANMPRLKRCIAPRLVRSSGGSSSPLA